MSVTIDHEPLAAIELGLTTIGQVLAHVQKDKRLVVQVLVDGQEPQPQCLRQTKLADHTIYIETADPRQLALEVLDEATQQIGQASQHKSQAADLLQKNQLGKAMEHLCACLRCWQNTQESVGKTAQLLRIDLEKLRAGGQPIGQLIAQFSERLRQIKQLLEQRDYVALADLLIYEMPHNDDQWQMCLSALRELIVSLR